MKPSEERSFFRSIHATHPLLFGGPLSAPLQLVESYPELKELALMPEN